MSLVAFLERLHDEDGAVTVDWVVLTAAIVSLGAVAGNLIWGDTGGLANDIASFIGTQSVSTTF